MSRLGILNPGSLLGHEIKEALGRRRDLWTSIDLLELEAEDFATVSEVAGEAVVVKSADSETLAALDVLFVCPGDLPPTKELAKRLGASGTTIVISPPEPVPGGEPIVAGINLERATRGGVLVSPPAGAIALAHLLRPLQPLGLTEAVAWIVQPVSLGEQAMIDDLLDQSRRMLAFEGDAPDGVIGRRLVHNLYPAGSPTVLTESVLAVLGEDIKLSAETVDAGVFHSVAVSVWARCAEATELETVRRSLLDYPPIEMGAQPSPPGPVEAAGGGTLLTAEVRPDSRRPGAFWLWGAADNLTFGGSANALAIAEALLAPAN